MGRSFSPEELGKEDMEGVEYGGIRQPISRRNVRPPQNLRRDFEVPGDGHRFSLISNTELEGLFRLWYDTLAPSRGKPGRAVRTKEVASHPRGCVD